MDQKQQSNQQKNQTGAVNVVYVDGRKNVLRHHLAHGPVGSLFNLDHYRSTEFLPAGYRFRRIVSGAGVFTFEANLQMVVIEVQRQQRSAASGASVRRAKVSAGSASQSSEKSASVASGSAPVQQQSSSVQSQSDQAVHAAHQLAKTQGKAGDLNPKDLGRILIALSSSLKALGEAIDSYRKRSN